MPFPVTIEWSSRSKALRARLRQGVSGVSFWLEPATSPVQIGFVAPALVGTWSTAATIPLTVTTDLSRQSATATVPDGPAHVRLDFDLVATAGGQSSTVLSFRQLFMVVTSGAGPGAASAGTLVPVQFSFD